MAQVINMKCEASTCPYGKAYKIMFSRIAL